MSKEQQRLWDAIKEFYPMRIVPNFRPDKLKNQKTGQNLEVDLFLYDHQVGVEYQGMIHFKEIDRYKNNPDSSRYNDVLKTELAAKKGRFAIIEVFPQDLKGDIKQNFINRLLITQELYIRDKQFKKCKSLEMVYMYITGVKNKNNYKLFDKIHEVNRFDNFCHAKMQNISNLRQFMNDPNIKLDSMEREYFSYDYISKILGIDNPKILWKQKIRLRYQNIPFDQNKRDHTGELIRNIIANPNKD